MSKFSPSRLIQRARHIRVENKGLKLLSVLLAVMLFIVSRQPVTDVRLVGVPIEYRGLSAAQEISGDLEQSVSVRVSGPRDIVRTLISSQLLVVADLSNKEPGERIVQLRADEASLPDNVRILQIEPSSLRTKLEPKARKRVKVEPRFSGLVVEEMEIYKFNLSPAETEIEGPQSQIAKIDRVMTETVDLTGRRESFQTSVEIEIPHRSLRVRSPAPINLSVEIGERRVHRHISGIPVLWLDQHAGGRLRTRTVEIEVFGPKSAVESLIADDLIVEINTSDLRSGTDRIAPQVRLAESVDKNIKVKSIIPREVKLKR
jgi:YbbR domain-containing protein